MLKLTAVVSLMLIATWTQADSKRYTMEAASEDSDAGSTLWAASLSCDSCGTECASACGTRHFRACCFNYLRRKRDPEGLKLWSPNVHVTKTDFLKKMPVLAADSIQEPWPLNVAEFEPYALDDANDNRLQMFYDV